MPTEKTYLVESPSQRAERLKCLAAAVFGEGKENRNRRLRRLGAELVGIRDLVEEGCTLAEFLRSRGIAGLGSSAFVSEFTETIDAIRTQPAEKSKRARQAVADVIEVLGEWSGKVGRPGSSTTEVWAACRGVAAYLSAPANRALSAKQRRREYAEGAGVSINLFERALTAGIGAKNEKEGQNMSGPIQAADVYRQMVGQGLHVRPSHPRKVDLAESVKLGPAKLKITAAKINEALALGQGNDLSGKKR